MGDTAMQVNPVLWSEPLATDRAQLKESVDADEEEEPSQEETATFEILEPNHSFLYSTVLARNFQVSKTAFLNLSLPTTTEIEEEEEEILVQLDGETKEVGCNIEEGRPTPKRTTPCKRISYKIKRSSSTHRKLNNRNPIRGTTVAELASKFDKLCLEKKFILDDPKFAQIIKRVNSQSYLQGDAGKINRKSSFKMGIDEKNIRRPSFKQNNNEHKSENIEPSVSVRAAIKIFEDRQQNDTKNLQLAKPKVPEKKFFSKSLEILPSIAVSHAENNENKDDFDEVPVLIVNIPVEKTIRSESVYEMTHVKSKAKEKTAKIEVNSETKSKCEEIKSVSPVLSRNSEGEDNLYDLVIPPSGKVTPEKKIQPPVPPKPKNLESRKLTKKKTQELIEQLSESVVEVSETIEELSSGKLQPIGSRSGLAEVRPERVDQEKAYEELSLPPNEGTHSYEDIEQKSDDDGYEAIIPLNILEQNIYETLPSMRDSPPPLPKRREELLPPKLPSKNSYYKVHASDELNSYEIIDAGEIFRRVVASEGSSESSYDTLMQLKWNSSGSNRGSLISCDQQSNSLYGRSGWTEDCSNYKADSDSFSDRSDDWSDMDENEDVNYSETTIAQKRKNKYTHKPPDTNSEADTDHHYESVPEGFLQNHYTAESFDSDYDTTENRVNVPYNNVDITNSQLPDTPNNQTNVLDRLSTAGKNLKRLFSKNDITKSLGRITKKKSRTDLDNLNSTLDRGKARSSTKFEQRDATPRNSLTSQDSNSDQTYVEANYEKQKFKNKAKSTFYLTETIDISSSTDKVDCERRKSSLSPVSQKSKNGKSSPVRPSIPPPPLPKQSNVNDSSNTNKTDHKRSTSWYVESGLFKNSESVSNISKRTTASWYAEVGLYQGGPRSTPSTSSAENSGSGVSNKNELDDINYENTEEYHNLKNETEYNNSMDSFGSNETKMDKSSTMLSEDMQHILQEEPLYQFYNAAIVESLCHEGTDWDSDGYEEISNKSENSETRLRPSAMDLITTNGNSVSVSRTLWCEIPEVKQSEIFSTLSLDQKKLQEAKFEMMTSEASYLNSLNVLTKHFIQNLYKCKTASKDDMDVLFGKIPEVKNCSEKLLQDLEKCWQDNILLQDICDIIHRHAEENFSVYVSYVENQVLLENILKRLREGTEFRETLQRLETSMDCQALTLYSFLMLPMQRVTRWPLLLDAVLKRLSPEDAEYLACQCALTTINKIANQCNEAARRKEREAEMKTIVNRIDFGPQNSFNLMSEGRWLIRSGAVTQMLARGDDGKLTFGKKLIKKPLFLFLFNDLFIITKYQTSDDNYSVIHYCPRNMIEINVDMAPNLPVKDTANRHLVFLTILENQHEKLVEILFSCNTTTDKERWLNALAQAKSEDPDETLYERWDCPQVTVIYDYNVTQPDELNITKGDIIYVIRKMSDGWYYGERLRDGQCGWFPNNYVVEIVNPHVRARNLRQRYRLLAFTQSYFNSKQ